MLILPSIFRGVGIQTTPWGLFTSLRTHCFLYLLLFNTLQSLFFLMLKMSPLWPGGPSAGSWASFESFPAFWHNHLGPPWPFSALSETRYYSKEPWFRSGFQASLKDSPWDNNTTQKNRIQLGTESAKESQQNKGFLPFRRRGRHERRKEGFRRPRAALPALLVLSSASRLPIPFTPRTGRSHCRQVQVEVQPPGHPGAL